MTAAGKDAREHPEARLAATRAGRLARIVDLLAAHQVRSQSELQQLLADEGIDATQATLSRDLDELGAVKLRAADGGAGVVLRRGDGAGPGTALLGDRQQRHHGDR